MADLFLRSSTQTTLLALAQAQKTLQVSAQRIQSGLRISSPTEGVAAFFDASGLSGRATQLLSIKEKITEAATITGGTVSALNSVINVVNQLKTQALTARAATVSTTVVGNIVSSAAAVITGTVAGAVNNDSFDITYNGTTTTITNNASETFTSLAAQIDAITGLTATVSDGNALSISAADGNDIVITNNVNTLATDLGLATSTNGLVASATAIETAESQHDVLRQRINALVGQATYHGTNLISHNPDTLKVTLSEGGTSSISISGIASDASGLGISEVNAANSFATEAGINAVIVELDTALTTLQATKASFTANDIVFDTRLSYTDSLIALLNEGAVKLVGVNLDAESALSLATQTRRDLTLSGINILLSDNALLSILTPK